MPDVSAEIANEFWWSKLGFWILVVGLAGEILILRVPKTHETLEKILTLVFVIVIIFGVTFEHNADLAVAELISKQEIDAGITIAALGKDAATSNERARALEKQAEELRAKNLTLEGEIAPRSVDKAGCAGISDAAKLFSGLTVRVATYTLDIDGGSLGWQIADCLWLSHTVNVDKELASILPIGGFGVGVSVSGRNEPLVSAIKGALAKAKVLVVEGTGLFPGNLEKYHPGALPNPDAIVVVGVKPTILMK